MHGSGENFLSPLKISWSMSSTGYRTCNFHGNLMRLLLSSALGGHSVGCATTAYVLLLYRDGMRWWCRASEVLCCLGLSVMAVGSALTACSSHMGMRHSVARIRGGLPTSKTHTL